MIFWDFLPGLAVADVEIPPSFEATERTPAKAVGTSDTWLKLTDRELLASKGLPGASNHTDGTLVTACSTPDPPGTEDAAKCSIVVFNFQMNSSTDNAQTDPSSPILESIFALTVPANSFVIRWNDDSNSAMVTGKPVTVPTTQLNFDHMLCTIQHAKIPPILTVNYDWKYIQPNG